VQDVPALFDTGVQYNPVQYYPVQYHPAQFDGKTLADMADSTDSNSRMPPVMLTGLAGGMPVNMVEQRIRRALEEAARQYGLDQAAAMKSGIAVRAPKLRMASRQMDLMEAIAKPNSPAHRAIIGHRQRNLPALDSAAAMGDAARWNSEMTTAYKIASSSGDGAASNDARMEAGSYFADGLDEMEVPHSILRELLKELYATEQQHRQERGDPLHLAFGQEHKDPVLAVDAMLQEVTLYDASMESRGKVPRASPTLHYSVMHHLRTREGWAHLATALELLVTNALSTAQALQPSVAHFSHLWPTVQSYITWVIPVLRAAVLSAGERACVI
jgi:hypothetical protein